MTGEPASFLRVAREYDRKGSLTEAATAYRAVISSAEAAGDRRVAAEALRRLAVVHCRLQQSAPARDLCSRSEVLARETGDADLLAEALNTAGGIDLVDECFDTAQMHFIRAASIAADPDLLGRIEQNLATIASTRGDYDEALVRYQRSLEGFLAASNVHGCAVAYHNLGVASIELRHWDDADRYLRLCLTSVQRTGDLHLHGLAALNHAEALTWLGRLREARVAAETSIGVFDELHAPRELADAYRILGGVLRRSGELAAAQTRLHLAVEVASTSRCALSEAEATRDLAIVLAALGQVPQALAMMARAATELQRLKPAVASAATLGEYPASVRAWRDLLEVMDPNAAANSERVATRAVAVARELGCDEAAQVRIRLAGCLYGFEAAWLVAESLPSDVAGILRNVPTGGSLESKIVALAADCERERTLNSADGSSDRLSA
jgi:tetratricopeptide (TPR) repeat protein